ncbi:MAG TPA: alkaline phosphatase family protein [Candidatus Acidoferrum sp.]|nr:alkaline phosphatase family protein [Candidatus Acidoferrum sp.]
MKKSFRAAIILSALLATLAISAIAEPGPGKSPHPSWDGDHDRRIRHVFVIVLENEGYDVTFGPTSKAPYLSKTLPTQGVLLTQYYGTGHVSLDNYIAMLSGQAATPQTRNDCTTYADYILTGVTPDGQAIGTGCVYPSSIKTLPDQLNAVGKTWRGYMGDMGNDPTRESATCGHPVLNTADLTQSAEAPSASVPLGDQYASRHDPFVYFHSIIDSPDCEKNVVNLTQLPLDLAREETTPNFVFITPNLCDDGHDAPCKNGQPGGLVSADAFLQKWIPLIQASKAYQRDGLIVINFDEGGLTIQAGSNGQLSILAPGLFCCNEQPGPNLAPFPQTTNITPTVSLTFENYGGDRTGAVLLSPFLKPGTVSNTPFNHFSLLKSLEDIFDTDEYLGYAGQPGLVGFFGCVTSDIAAKDRDQFPRCENH